MEGIFATAEALTTSIRNGTTRAQMSVDAHLERIAQYDQLIHAYVYVDRDARAEPGLLSGVTVGVKDTVPVSGMPWTCGSPKWKDRIARHDAMHIARLRRAGATVLGKTNMPEMAAGSVTVNDLFPPTNNPWRIGVSPGGSSGGSAAAVAAGMCTVGIGDDFAGSVRIPAACCGVVGMKPSGGLLRASDDDLVIVNCGGAITRCVGDAAFLLSVMIGARRPTRESSTYRIGVAYRSRVGTHAACENACQRAAQHLIDLGHSVVDIDWDSSDVIDALRVVRPVALGVAPGHVEEFGARVQASISQGRAASAVEFVQALQSGAQAAGRVAKRLDSDLDYLLTPTLSDPPGLIEKAPAFGSSEWPRIAAFTIVANFAGLPAISIPAGYHDGLPLGIQLVGRSGSDWGLMHLAQDLEKYDFHRFREPKLGMPPIL